MEDPRPWKSQPSPKDLILPTACFHLGAMVGICNFYPWRHPFHFLIKRWTGVFWIFRYRIRPIPRLHPPSLPAASRHSHFSNTQHILLDALTSEESADMILEGCLIYDQAVFPLLNNVIIWKFLTIKAIVRRLVPRWSTSPSPPFGLVTRSPLLAITPRSSSLLNTLRCIVKCKTTSNKDGERQHF